ncbi:hypothetical protein GCM10011415_15840 [Salipiger pallidus]|uniref:AB hydrolase-1 domain-containing protein n=2 Tax=Salipiger pallidus TaxID=1775170 RepID=A0A8J2ZJ38_9RHOB|nr:hypothetical protein GCM10011415_15840 [Salipiger pallidus]
MAAPALAQDTEGRAMSGDLGIHDQVHGDLGSGMVPFLVLYGGMGSIEGDFGAHLPSLAARRPVIGVEQRTGGRDTLVTLAAMRADTLSVLDALDVGRAHAVGFSMGGMLALDLALSASERLATLTVISVSQNLDGMHPAIAKMNRNPTTAPSADALKLLPSEEDLARMQAGFSDNPDGPEQFGRTFAQLQAFIVSDWGWSDQELAALAVPTLLALGDSDFTPVEHGAHIAAITEAQLAVLPDATHLSITCRSDCLLPLIFLRITTAGTGDGAFDRKGDRP